MNKNKENKQYRKRNKFKEYCKLIEEQIKYISEDEVKTAQQFDKVLKKYKIKKVSTCTIHKYLPEQYFFRKFYKRYEPIIIKNLHHKIGPCLNNFTTKNILYYLGKTNVSIHESSSKFLNNVNKNFKYVLATLEYFISLIENQRKKKYTYGIEHNHKNIYITLNEKDAQWKNQNEMNTKEKKTEEEKYYYYRSLGINQFKEVSNVKQMNPFIKNNFFIPLEIYPKYEQFEFFSSVLRIGQTNIFIWMHYDIPDNFLIQIEGRKKILLLHPKFIKYFNIIDSSSPYNLFQILLKKKVRKKERIIKNIIRKYGMVANLEKGDILFIPSMWLHYVFNMPTHTCVSKKLRNMHRKIKIKKLDTRSQTKTKTEFKQKPKQKEEETWDILKNIKKSRKFKTVHRGKLSKQIFCREAGTIQFLNFKWNYPKKKSTKKNCVLYYFESEENTQNTQNINKEEEQNILQHYNHLEKYEDYIKEKYKVQVSVKEENNIKQEILKPLKEKNDRHKCWKHMNTNLNISVNFFFREREERSMFNKKDLYGNQDVHEANHLFQHMKREIEHVLSLPKKYKNLYLQKLQGLLYSYLDDEYL